MSLLVQRLILLLAVAGLTGCAMLGTGGDRVTLDVRNDLGRPVVLEITSDAMQAAVRPARIAAPITIPANHDGPVTFASPVGTWSLRIVGDEGFFDSRDLHDWARQLKSGEISTFALVVQTNGQLAAETSQ